MSDNQKFKLSVPKNDIPSINEKTGLVYLAGKTATCLNVVLIQIVCSIYNLI